MGFSFSLLVSCFLDLTNSPQLCPAVGTCLRPCVSGYPQQKPWALPLCDPHGAFWGLVFVAEPLVGGMPASPSSSWLIPGPKHLMSSFHLPFLSLSQGCIFETHVQLPLDSLSLTGNNPSDLWVDIHIIKKDSLDWWSICLLAPINRFSGVFESMYRPVTAWKRGLVHC